MDGLIKYNHAGIDTASMEIAASSKAMNGQLDALKGALRDIESRWEGAGSAAYLAQKAKWDQSAEDLNLVLAQISQAVSQGNQDMSSTDARVSSSFGG